MKINEALTQLNDELNSIFNYTQQRQRNRIGLTVENDTMSVYIDTLYFAIFTENECTPKSIRIIAYLLYCAVRFVGAD